MRSVYLVSLLASLAHSYVSPPRREIGFVYNGGAPDALVHVDVYIDLLCPDSKQTWLPITDMAKHYGADKVRLTVYLFPLPYHQNAFYATKATFVVHAQTNGTKTFDWIERIMLHEIPTFSDSSWHMKSDADLLSSFSALFTEVVGVDSTTFTTLVDRQNRNVYEGYSRSMWKYACTRGVAETPSYFVNGINDPSILKSWTLENWQEYIDPLVLPFEFDHIDSNRSIP